MSQAERPGAELVSAMTRWRRYLHAHPEFGFEEKRTAAFVAARLREFGLDEVVEGVGGTGVVGTLRRGTRNRAVALRADMDALRITEAGTRDHRSEVPGTMHACGHDGHTAMLLGAARHLAEAGGFDGMVRFVFQPAEEWGQGALAMLRDGLMQRFPFDEIYGLHNMPGLPVGAVQSRAGAFMSAEDIFAVDLKGVGGHASRPHWGREVLVAACALVMDLQTIVSRRLSPTDIAVVSATELTTDGTRNVLPGQARVAGDARSFEPAVSAAIERELRRIAAGIAVTYDCTADVTYTREFVPLRNDPALVEAALAAVRAVPGAIASHAAEPMTASEDFARFLDHVPGAFLFVGNGEGSAPLHNPSYDFNDAALPFGMGLHAAIVRHRLPANG